MTRWAFLALTLLLGGCAITLNKPLTSDDFRHTAAQQGDFEFAFPNCRVVADRILTDGPPVEGEEFQDRLNASDRALIRCMGKLGYPYRPKEELLVPWHD
ncbi:MAG: hypothetical protein ISS15_19325 [Alphaproteobacteria bacterium]|nr:hypothetical protein [Alphaproteobacteria bacterium]MBL6939896.1 hypothetical protein [Alphaproteobacteria bacterium]MBL7099814.1 hypothetical protein [Alphaproteobacteria bacterium]